MVDDEGRIVDAAVTDGPEETREARTSFLAPLPDVRMTWPPLIPPPAFPEPLPLQRLSEMKVFSPTDPDEEGEHMTDVETPGPMENTSEPSLSTQVSLRVTIDMDPNSQLYIYHLRLKPLEFSSCAHACMHSVPIDPIRRRGDVAAGERSPSPVPTVSRPVRVESPFFGSCLNSDHSGG